MHFFKYHGTGNDFVCFDNREKTVSLSPEKIQWLCDRHFGIGADGVILMEFSENGGDIFMNYYNADGSISEMCGNGVRVAARFATEIFGLQKSEILVDTRDGIKTVKIFPDHFFQVNMGVPKFSSADFPEKSEEIFGHEWNFVSMGNPHAVGFFEDEFSQQRFLEEYGKKMESNVAYFPKKINVSSVWKKKENVFGVQTFERGCGFTLACGTAASGCFAWILKKFPENAGKKIQINIPGGTLFFEISKNGEILMSGPAEKVFEGEIFL